MHYPLRFNIFSLFIHELYFITVMLNCGKKCKLVFSVKFACGSMCLEVEGLRITLKEIVQFSCADSDY